MIGKIQEMRRKTEKMKCELEKIYEREKNFPKGELVCAKNNKHYKWYVKDQKGTSYLPKNKKELAEKLALKKYYVLKKQELESALSACNAYIRKMLSKEGRVERLLEHPEYGKLLE